MKVLLCEDVGEVGWLGDVVEVSSGYARNYLIPQGLAVIPTEGALQSLAEEKARRAEQRMKVRRLVEAAAGAVSGAEVFIRAKANEQGHLFGSVGKAQIAANLREQGFGIADEIVQLTENIKEVGTTAVELKFADELTATVNVVVVADQADQKEESESTDQDK